MIKVKLYLSTSCQTCGKMKNVLSSICDEINIKLDFIWKEDDKDNEFGRHGVNQTPTMIVTKDNTPVNSYVGLQSRSEIISKLSQYKEM